jgi:hypothetical protein
MQNDPGESGLLLLLVLAFVLVALVAIWLGHHLPAG